jgi:hypothetical protein
VEASCTRQYLDYHQEAKASLTTFNWRPDYTSTSLDVIACGRIVKKRCVRNNWTSQVEAKARIPEGGELQNLHSAEGGFPT